MLADPGGPGLAGLGSESAIDVKAAARRGSALCGAATPRAYKGAASEKTVTSNKNLRYYSAMEAHAEDHELTQPDHGGGSCRPFTMVQNQQLLW